MAVLPPKTREFYEAQEKNCRGWLLIFSLLTLINALILITGNDLFFYVSAVVPYFILYFFAENCGIFPVEHYREVLKDSSLQKSDLIFEPTYYFVIAIVIVLLIVGFLALCWFLSKKHPVMNLVAATLVALDGIACFFLLLMPASLISAFFHVLVVFQLVIGFLASGKKQTAPSIRENEVPPFVTGPSPWGNSTYGTDSTVSTDSTTPSPTADPAVIDTSPAEGAVTDSDSGTEGADATAVDPSPLPDDDPFAKYDVK